MVNNNLHLVSKTDSSIKSISIFELNAYFSKTIVMVTAIDAYGSQQTANTMKMMHRVLASFKESSFSFCMSGDRDFNWKKYHEIFYFTQNIVLKAVAFRSLIICKMLRVRDGSSLT